MEPNPSLTHTVPGLWLERARERERQRTGKKEEKEKTKAEKERRRQGFRLQGTSRAFVKGTCQALPPSVVNLSLLLPFSGCPALPLVRRARVEGEE